MGERSREIWDAPAPTDEATWLVCRHAHLHGSAHDDCQRCPRSRPDPHYGALTDGCRLCAEETFAAAYVGMMDAGWQIAAPAGTPSRAAQIKAESKSTPE